MKTKNIQISIVIPCYKEENYIRGTLTEVNNVLKEITINYEIICVVDGILDKTFDIASEIAKKSGGKIRVFGYYSNKGKGFALRVGFREAGGDFVGFIDGDGQIGAQAIGEALKEMNMKNADIVIGSKRHGGSKITYSKFRNLISYVSQFVIKKLFDVGVSDTQAGIKLFRKDVVKKLEPRLTINRFGFDIEALAVSKYLGYRKIEEIPIKVKMLEEDSGGVNLLLFIRDVIRTLFEIVPIFYRLRIEHYYSDSNKNNWLITEKTHIIKA